jgi:hypothetical protein
MPIVTYIRDISSRYDDSLEDIVSFLKRNATPDETLVSNDPEFPLIFYTDLRVIDVRLPSQLATRDPNEFPDWIFDQSASGAISNLGMTLRPRVGEAYDVTDLVVHASPRGDNRPDPIFHVNFMTGETEKFRIYRKKKPQAK